MVYDWGARSVSSVVVSRCEYAIDVEAVLKFASHFYGIHNYVIPISSPSQLTSSNHGPSQANAYFPSGCDLLSFQDAETVGIMCSQWRIHLFFKAKQWSMWTTWFCHWKCSGYYQGGRMWSIWLNGSELQVVESAKRINYHLPPASRMVIPSHCLICDGQRCVCHSGYQTNHKPHLGSIWSIHPVFQVRSHFMFVCSLYFLWLSKIITLDSGTENGLWTPGGVHFIFILFCDDFIIPLCLSFSQNFVGFFFPFSFFSIIFGLPICGVQLHGSDPMPGFGLCSSEQQKTPRLLIS